MKKMRLLSLMFSFLLPFYLLWGKESYGGEGFSPEELDITEVGDFKFLSEVPPEEKTTFSAKEAYKELSRLYQQSKNIKLFHCLKRLLKCNCIDRASLVEELYKEKDYSDNTLFHHYLFRADQHHYIHNTRDLLRDAIVGQWILLGVDPKKENFSGYCISKPLGVWFIEFSSQYYTEHAKNYEIEEYDY